MAVLEQRLADALGDAAVDLAVDDERVHRTPDIIDRGIIDERHLAGIRIDLDLADMRAVRVARLHHGFVASSRERSAQIFRQISALDRRARHLEQSDGVVGALHGETAARKFDVGGGGFQKMFGNAQAFFDQAIG